MQSALRFSFILLLFWILLATAYSLSSSWRDDLLRTCLAVFSYGLRKQGIFDHFLCTTYDFFHVWWWLLFFTVPPLAALATTFAFRRTAA